MRCVYVSCKYGEPYIQYQQGLKHWDFKILSKEEVMSPLTGEILPRKFDVIVAHIQEYIHLTPVNRPL